MIIVITVCFILATLDRVTTRSLKAFHKLKEDEAFYNNQNKTE